MFKHPCNVPGCPELIEKGGYCKDHSSMSKPFDNRYNSTRWRKCRVWHLNKEPLCRQCNKDGKVTSASIVDHIQTVRDNKDPMFWNESNWQSLCPQCHYVKSMRELKGEQWKPN